jgi:diguanylate cyclase (GGDEF)-like protein
MVLSTIYENVNKLMDAGIFAIGLYDDAMGIIDYKMIIEDSKRQPLFQTSADDASSIASIVINSGREIMQNDSEVFYTENAAMQGAGGEGRKPKSVICCPLRLMDSITGVITVQSYQTNAYSERNLETIKALASYIAIALNNSRQSDELKAKAAELELALRTDALTGLYNRRHVLEKIDEERIRFQRNARPFSIVICDIDFFKKVNDVYGHDCGDAVLKALAGLLGRHIRKQDCLARWGGEEFLLLLPETSKAGASVLAKKLRQRVEEFEFAYAGLKLPITMTFGVAEYISDFGIDACIVGADSALYKGKNSGRNCVVTF